MTIDRLRQHYLNMAPYEFDHAIPEGLFSDDEIRIVKSYGHWFEAIWEDKVPLETDKLRHFYAAKDLNFSDRTRIEDIWFRYEREKCPF